jgi:hypothetical protein
MPFERGRQKTGGRIRGVPNRETRKVQAEVKASGQTMLEYMVGIVHDETADADRRDRMAIAAAPYLHPKLQVVDSTIRATVEVNGKLSADELRARARAAIAEAFA